MWVQHNNRFTKPIPGGVVPNVWDFVAFILVISLLVLLMKGASDMRSPYQVGEVITIHLDPSYLP